MGNTYPEYTKNSKTDSRKQLAQLKNWARKYRQRIHNRTNEKWLKISQNMFITFSNQANSNEKTFEIHFTQKEWLTSMTQLAAKLVRMKGKGTFIVVGNANWCKHSTNQRREFTKI